MNTKIDEFNKEKIFSNVIVKLDMRALVRFLSNAIFGSHAKKNAKYIYVTTLCIFVQALWAIFCIRYPYTPVSIPNFF